LGDRVRLKKGVTKPVYDWRHEVPLDTIGTVVEIEAGDGDYPRVGFGNPEMERWAVAPEELELVAPDFKVGDRVRVRAGIEKPCHGWGDVKAGDIGVITSLGAPMIVDFPAQPHWQAKADEMELVEEVEPPKQEPCTPKTYYKGFRVGEDEELLSLVKWDGGEILAGTKTYKAPVLTYKEGQITYTPEGTEGIFITETLGEAKGITRANGGGATHKVIHEVTPLGNIEHGKGNNSQTSCPAILVGKKVFEYNAEPPKPPEPVENWVDITSQCQFKRVSTWLSIYEPTGFYEIFLCGPKGIVPYSKGKDTTHYKLDTTSKGFSYECGDFRVLENTNWKKV